MKIFALSIESTGGRQIQVQNPGGVPTGGIEKVSGVVQNLLVIFFVLGTLLAFLFLVFGGIRWITSGGEKEGVEHARKTVTYAIIGLVLLFSSFLILNILGKIIGVNILNVTFTPLLHQAGLPGINPHD